MIIHHIGYLVKKIEKAKVMFEKLGFKEQKPIVYDGYRKIDICFMEKDGYVVELVSPAGEDSVVSGLIKHYRNSPYHLCYMSNNFDTDIDKLCNDGYVKIMGGGDCPAPAMDGKRIAFLMSPVIGMIEIAEK